MEGGRTQGVGIEQIFFIQLPRAGAGVCVRLYATLFQHVIQSSFVRTHEGVQSFGDTLLHFCCRLAGEGDGEDAVRSGAGQQQSQDAGNQQPGLADPARNATVHASAGTGKTWLLVTRILRLLLAGARPDSILAVTFTRKAAAEMQQRVTE
ncbi:MAG: hypothetical protein DRQ45_00820, partial [Gammaproteobacteria bacterium]